VLQWCYKGVTEVVQRRYRGVTIILLTVCCRRTSLGRHNVAVMVLQSNGCGVTN
jgi:hypothetical protein